MSFTKIILSNFPSHRGQGQQQRSTTGWADRDSVLLKNVLAWWWTWALCLKNILELEQNWAYWFFLIIIIILEWY